ncbi:MAG: UDP-3-O-acyl-N-acetylglucosamine deacetylase [Cyanobacteria bacterium J06627_15]
MTPATQPDSATVKSEPATAQRTLAQPLVREGVGLHSGKPVRVQVKPAAADEGRYFVRTDLPKAPRIPATAAAVGQTTLSTELTVDGASVRTVEHLLAALWGLGIDNARIEIDGPEVPLLDGSAKEWGGAISAAQVQALPVDQTRLPALTDPIHVHHQDAFVTAIPSPSLRFTYGIDFEVAPIGNQWHSWSPDSEAFIETVAPARTFGLAHQIEMLQAQGLIKGGSLDNALVCGQDSWVNPPLRFGNEPVRHKLLDLIGDLSLLGVLPTMHVVAYKASHRLHVALAQKLAAVYAANR